MNFNLTKEDKAEFARLDKLEPLTREQVFGALHRINCEAPDYVENQFWGMFSREISRAATNLKIFLPRFFDELKP